MLILTVTCFFRIQRPPTWKTRPFEVLARMVILRFLAPNWCVDAYILFVPTANPEASDFDLMEFLSPAVSTSVTPPSCTALMDCFHFFPSGPFSVRNRSTVDSRTASAIAALMPFLSMSASCRSLFISLLVSPSSLMLYIYIPFRLSREKRRGLDATEKPVRAAVVVSTAPISTFPSASNSKNRIAALYRFR
ncbi:hypothetical protein SAMN02745176_01651 [Lutispora thermophila DSM 19022]|uniref:Uncharacterized protein n=1 Tax=Lutispora thermophila DSM 19022 TaxID=1122184 RepID=A0A1M6ER59_9FIRM|nr:hypothetical protein SAMN02745176_01651 [Lutispora thermophila DSM 19022]